MLKLYNTLTRKKEIFKPIKPGKVGLYACGPTVYSYAHIGNLRTYIFEDILRRTLEYNGYEVKHIINITDVGHLTSDADTGEDKMEKSAQKENRSIWEIAKEYTDAFKRDIKKLNIKDPSVWTKATDYIDEQLELIKELEKKGFAYLISDGVYFDTSKMNDYGKLWGSKDVQLIAGASIEVVEGKKNPSDFALWKLTPPGVKRQMEWDSPWGKGFPGWHTECVAMAKAELGIPFDIHCGGIDHIQIHHTNEIAQSEIAYGKIPSRFWMHGEFLDLKSEKMSKSKGNVIRIKTLEERGINPLAYRYLCLGAHYRTKITFSWKALEAAQNGINHLTSSIASLEKDKNEIVNIKKEKDKFLEIINDDLNTPKALAFLQDIIKDKELSDSQKYALAMEFDQIFGLNLYKKKKKKHLTATKISYYIISEEDELPEKEKIDDLIIKQVRYKKEKNWKKADEARKKIEEIGYNVKDTEKGLVIEKINGY